MACPICDRPVNPAVRPFCSKRCADVDLAKWLSGSYAIPSTDPEDDEQLFEELSAAENKPH